jgi:hypothetical protein
VSLALPVRLIGVGPMLLILSGLLSGCVSDAIDSVAGSARRVLGYDSQAVGTDSKPRPTASELKSGWTRSGHGLDQVKENEWLDPVEQSVIGIVCGHVRRWSRPGPNLVSLSSIQGDPFKMPDPNQLVSSQTWFWSVRVSDDEPRVAQSRYLKTPTDVGFELTELWEIRDLGFVASNIYRFDENGDPTELVQAVHPSLPRLTLKSDKGVPCVR